MGNEKSIRRAKNIYWLSLLIIVFAEAIKSLQMPYFWHVLIQLLIFLVATAFAYIVYDGFKAIANENSDPILQKIFFLGFILGVLEELWVLIQVSFSMQGSESVHVIPLIFSGAIIVYSCAFAYRIKRLPNYFRNLPKLAAFTGVNASVGLGVFLLVSFVFKVHTIFLLINFLIGIVAMSFVVLSAIYTYLLLRAATQKNEEVENRESKFWNFWEKNFNKSFWIMTSVVFVLFILIGVYHIFLNNR